jgi:hypothetical protein
VLTISVLQLFVGIYHSSDLTFDILPPGRAVAKFLQQDPLHASKPAIAGQLPKIQPAIPQQLF